MSKEDIFQKTKTTKKNPQKQTRSQLSVGINSYTNWYCVSYINYFLFQLYFFLYIYIFAYQDIIFASYFNTPKHTKCIVSWESIEGKLIIPILLIGVHSGSSSLLAVACCICFVLSSTVSMVTIFNRGKRKGYEVTCISGTFINMYTK